MPTSDSVCVCVCARAMADCAFSRIEETRKSVNFVVSFLPIVFFLVDRPSLLQVSSKFSFEQAEMETGRL